ncbi:aminoglycoside phosphotransferase (APT) family kinase protein [Arthrobacter pigmenti]|uniref:Aminoglycoside phosphotransferase (APT) family kinase protein n=1 Tax=Arthrobacter pigmenti TaxID=271432 RepID=A0A846RQ27_9MICC|nr:aminoglycoside phosphotransferase family protein [Arthrobacter pigmenti]NJC21845.1 aminoglycoside phosphotransferase (APT) family kinase protein [Arthrobacter pigmenti]
MANMPAAEIDITTELVQRLLDEQHPDLSGLPLTLVANGWDNAIFRLGKEFAVRLPRREAAANLIVNEQRWLRILTQGVKALTPVPQRTGAPSSYFPWYWTITRWIEGPLAADLPAADRTRAAEQLADFVLAFQQPAPADAPRNPVRGVPLSTRSRAVEKRIGGAGLAAELSALWVELRDQPPWEGEPLWLHGDLHAANIVLDSHCRLLGILDFGDLTSGDPATDLAAAWMVFDRNGRRAFINRINGERPTDAATWQRARGWALCMGSAMAATSDDNPDFQSMDRNILHEVLTDAGDEGKA